MANAMGETKLTIETRRLQAGTVDDLVVDGELLTKEPATFTSVPGALRVIVGPGYGTS